MLPLVTIEIVINSTDGAQHFAHAVFARSAICYGNPIFHATSSASLKEAYGESKYPVIEANKPNSHTL